MQEVAVKLALSVVVVGIALLASACPDRDKLVNDVGGAPAAQVDNAKARVGAAEDKLQKQAAEAAAAVADQ